MHGALQAAFTADQAFSTNLLLTHRDGVAIDLETTPGRHGWLYPTDGVLVHTNHFAAFVPEQLAATYRPFSSDSLYRLPRIERTLGLANAILAGAALSFLGLGPQPPTAEWGLMLADSRKYLQVAWWLGVFPGLAIMIAVLAINLLGDGVRDAIDPRSELRVTSRKEQVTSNK